MGHGAVVDVRAGVLHHVVHEVHVLHGKPLKSHAPTLPNVGLASRLEKGIKIGRNSTQINNVGKKYVDRAKSHF